MPYQKKVLYKDLLGATKDLNELFNTNKYKVTRVDHGYSLKNEHTNEVLFIEPYGARGLHQFILGMIVGIEEINNV